MRTNRIFNYLLFCVIMLGCFSISSAFSASSDKYEPDNTMETAKLINPNPMLPEDLLPPGYEWKQSHNFYTYGDEDWVYFYGRRGENYNITVKDVGKKCDPVIEIYNSKKEKVTEPVDDRIEGEAEYAEFRCETDDTYYVRIRQCNLNDTACHASYGDDTLYNLIMYMPAMINPGLLVLNNLPVGVKITLNMPEWDNWNATPRTQTLERYHGSGTFSLTASAQGYEECSQEVTIKEGKENPYDICLKENSPVNSFFPTIGSVSPPQTLTDTTSALIYANNVVDSDGIKRVWAVITPPNYISYSADTPVISLPTTELKSVGSNRYEVTYDRFIAKGTYRIVIFATDNNDFTSIPEEKHITTVTQTQGNSCVFVNDDLALNICAEYQNVKYGFTLKFDDAAQLSWEMDVGTFRELQSDPGNCISVGNDLKLDMCVEYQGHNYGVTMNYDTDMIWKMDVGTFKPIN